MGYVFDALNKASKSKSEDRGDQRVRIAQRDGDGSDGTNELTPEPSQVTESRPELLDIGGHPATTKTNQSLPTEDVSTSTPDAEAGVPQAIEPSVDESLEADNEATEPQTQELTDLTEPVAAISPAEHTKQVPDAEAEPVELATDENPTETESDDDADQAPHVFSAAQQMSKQQTEPPTGAASGNPPIDPPVASDGSDDAFDDQPDGSDLNMVPAAPVGVDDRLVALISPGSLMAEEYRSVRTRLLARWQHRRNLIHTITSATPKEGKTLTSLNLSATFSEITDRKVVVVECDLRIPMFAKMLNLPAGPGVIQVLKGEAPVDDALRESSRGNLSIIAAGGLADDEATQMLSSPALPALLAELRHRFDHVIIDTPPVLELADAGIVGAQSDDVLLIVRMNRTPRHMVEEAINMLNGYEAPVTGAVLTDTRTSGATGGYGYRYGYRYGSRYSYHRRHGYRSRRQDRDHEVETLRKSA